jgi:hypothetical protein
MNEDVVFSVGFSLVGVLGLVILLRARTLAEAVHALQGRALVSFSFEQALGMLRVLGGAMVFMGLVAAVELIASAL